MPASAKRWFIVYIFLTIFKWTNSEILTPPYFNLAEGRKVTASATCGEDTEGPELYCKLVGPTNAAENDVNVNVIQGQHCDICDPTRPDKRHPPEYAVDGLETWWQSPPLSRGMKYNEVNLTIDLGQEFHVAYVYVRMGNSPRPGLWILEKSVDYGKTYTPWQYFSDSRADCEEYFGPESLQPITKDDSVICSTDHSRIVPLEGGEIPISILNNRPSANHYFNSSVLQEWTRATNVRLRLLRTKNLFGHLMSVERQDPTVTRRYFYSIKDISIGGRCMCNGHADSCDNRNPDDPSILECSCRHNTCGSKCEKCCPGFEQKAWRQSKNSAPFTCEPCNCFNHSNRCIYNAEVDKNHTSLDIYGKYEGGGICQNCQHNTEGINCNKCKSKYFRPYTKNLNDTDVCQPCDCEKFYSTGNCAEGSGRCECRIEFQPPQCDKCSFGYYGYPNCKSCDCYLNGTLTLQCEAKDGICTCKENFGGNNCTICADEYYNFPSCESCECNPLGSLNGVCDKISGNCTCKNNYGGRQCEQCQDGYYNYPSCPYCNCDVKGTKDGICDKETGKCICKDGYGGERCDQCIAGYYGYPNCKTCNCSLAGSAGSVCDATGKCPCLSNFAGRTCEGCSPGHYKYPECLSCDCDSHGRIGITCDNEGICQCRHNFDGERCNRCKEGFYNFPACEDCNCNPAGVIAAFAGCGSVPKGELCQCKERVQGRICDKCKPLYWNLNTHNPDGCEECKCNIPGVLGGIAVCDSEQGQCTCKPSVVARGCSECDDGTYNLQEDNLFGCTDCGCDVGGSISLNCDKLSGQCQCQPRVTGRTCKEPLQMHYFPTLFQHQYEMEENSRTPDSTLVRYGYNETEFPGYSYKGYASYSIVQREVLKDIYIFKSSLYRIVFRYVNKSPENIFGTIKIIPENPNDIEQKYQVQFKNLTTPTFTTLQASGAPVALVMNPGKWTVSIIAEANLLLDYFVLLPEEFYMASILNQKVEGPCKVFENTLCREFSYPNISQYDVSLGGGGYIDLGPGEIATLTEYYENFKHIDEVKIRNKVPLINEHQKEINYNITLSKPGPYVILVNYITPIDDEKTYTVDVGVINSNEVDSSYKFNKIQLYNCHYTTVCRQVVTNSDGIVGVYNADENLLHIKLKGEESNVGIQSIVAIPYEEWSLDYINPRPICIRKDGNCVTSSFPNPPESKKIQFEKEAIVNDGHNKTIYKPSNSTTYLHLHSGDNMVDVRSKVPTPGFYTFIVHYYQPEFPEYDVDVLMQNGLMYEAKIPVRHCPSKSGCRALVKQKDGNIKFSLTENFMITFKIPDDKNIYLDYVIVVPHDLYNQRILEEENLDRTGEFIANCGNNHFYIDPDADEFCKESVFSITSGYNNGALHCQCDYDGSLSFQCEKFGGQCQCRPNVIGRQCTFCKTGYYGFPECKPCNCPSSSTCDVNTGQCICPMHVIGERCDQCEPMTYGFDPFSGCEECKCNPLGVEKELQCDLIDGNCDCKPNIIGRKCDTCLAGYFAYPYCRQCECDLRGTTKDICEQLTAECFCKEFVTGPACDICEDGTYDLQENNEVGCTECYCFGKTNRCYSSSFYKYTLQVMDDWDIVMINESDIFDVKSLNVTLHTVDEESFGVDLIDVQNETVYFSAPAELLGKKLTSYGGYLNYTIFYTIGDEGKATMKPDVILEGINTYLIYSGIEQPAAAEDYSFSLQIVETNFILPNGLPAKREHLMFALKNLQGIYIRATYWSITKTSRLMRVSLDIAEKFINTTGNYQLATSVEHCDCPANYQGLSCEECSPGHYRVNTGPHGGICVACKCNGHAEECDVNTGVCINCQHNTVGDHCEMCAVGYHGNALQGTPKDCLICACPLPITSNNFAHSCEVSSDGERISCDCNNGYMGARCQSCAPGFYGQPEVQGDYCKPCNCSGNINPEEPGSCDTVTGKCLKCLNNTYGEACAICAPGHYGDAVILKDCQQCVCDELGADRCNSSTGECVCRENVIGDKCDRCEVDHYGFSSGQGCKPCNCGEAATSLQCDDNTGQCRCKPGVTGRTCDKCAPGYWNYTIDGCLSCGCKSEYSRGFGCNAQTGQCECLPGVTGEKCDKCPYRWTFVPEYGCFGCDSCTHDLLDETDALSLLIDPTINEFDSVESGYFTTRRLAHINDTIKSLRPKVLQLSPDLINFTPTIQELDSMEQESNNMNRKANYSLDNSKDLVEQAGKLRMDSIDALEAANDAADDAADTIDIIQQLSTNLAEGEGPKIDEARKQAEDILNFMKRFNLTDRDEAANTKLDEALALFSDLKSYKEPVDTFQLDIQHLKDDLQEFNKKLDDLSNQTQYSLAKSAEAKELYDKNGKDKIEKKLDNIKIQTESIEQGLKDSENLLRNATKYLKDAKKRFKAINNDLDTLENQNNNFNNTLESNFAKIIAIEENKKKVQDHASELSRQAEVLSNLLAETRSSSENAVKAATAYNDINKAIDDAETAAEKSKIVVDETLKLLNGIENETEDSSSNALTLLDDAHKASGEVNDLNPILEKVRTKSAGAKTRHDKNDEQLKGITRYLENFQTVPLEDSLIDAMKNADDAEKNTKKTLDELKTGFKDVGNKTESAKNLPKSVYDTNRDIEQVKQNIDTVNEKLPELLKALNSIPAQDAQDKEITKNIEEKIKKLNQQIAIARDLANRIEVGVKFNRSTTLELKNPDNLQDLSTSTQISGYFQTAAKNGLLVYLGNGEGTNLRKTKSDDYMALQVENGYPVLTLDVGNGQERIINEKYVADNKWYKFIIDRTGLNAKLSIVEQLPDGTMETTTKEEQLEGPYSIFNLDKNQSKLFVGSYPLDFKMQDTVMQNSFEGAIEGLTIGEQPVSLWNFVWAHDNNQGIQRDSLRQTKTGYRFNGNGYAILNSRSYPFKSRSDIQLSFKTFAPEGLIFLNGKGNTFISLEIRNGRVVYKYNLGKGTKIFQSSKMYNDGLWHMIEATREGPKGRFFVDKEEVPDRSKPIEGNFIEPDDTIFFGGYPQHHNFEEITNVDFDGCIDNVRFTGNPVDLSTNIKAYGVTPGCPVKFSRLVSFHPRSPGYIKLDNVSSSNDLKVILKFKTKSKDGLIFYITDKNSDAGMSLSLEDGHLKLISQKMEIISKDNTFNDNEWHVVSVHHNKDALRLDFDDYGFKVTDTAPPPLHFLYGEIYLGGYPVHNQAEGDLYIPFSGCIGDGTINANILNFANSTDKYAEIVGKCILDPEIGSDSDIHTVPVLPPLHEIFEQTTQLYEPVTEPEFEGPKRGDGGKDDGPTDEDEIIEGEVPEVEVTTWPTPRPHPTVTTITPPVCALPMNPEIDEDVITSGSYRYGTEIDSRLEYKSSRGKYRKQFEFSLEFKTLAFNGIIFYVADPNHMNFVAIFIKEGYVHYVFNGGAGPATIISELTYNNDLWHEIHISRQGSQGILTIDGESISGKTPSETNKLEIFPPYYLGGVAPNTYNHVLGNLNMTESFHGCIRNFNMNNKPMEHPDKFGVIPCSDRVEQGVFFNSRGGFVKLKERFKVGLELDAKMDIKPRNLSGLIMAVHGRKDYFVLELDNGALKLTVDNGKGAISTRYEPNEPHLFCDGNWHSIQAVKSKSVVTLAVNGIYSAPGVGDHSSTSTDTGGFLFLGGHRLLHRAKGLTVRIPYVGCIRNVQVNNQNIPITANMAEGGVTVGSCPTN